MALRDDISERAQARVGQVLKHKYTLDRVVGIGGMATVYGATHRNKRRYAVKMLHAEVAVDQEVTGRFIREGYVANTVGHPGTVQVFDDDVTEDGAPFLVMELLEGETLEDRWERKLQALPLREVLAVVKQLLDVLAAAHAQGIVHRDLKPENLFLTSTGQLKVLDFGIARLRELSKGSAAATTTRAGSLLGTPAFMAPEQARGRWDEVDGRTDLWAVGATVFTLLTGRFVHESETLNEQLILAATEPADSLGKVLPETPPEVVQLVDRALAFKKEDRWPDAKTMLAATEATLEALGAGASLPKPSVVVNVDATTPAPMSTPSVMARSETVSSTAAAITSVPPVDPAPPRRSIRTGVLIGAVVGLAAAVAIGVVALRETPTEVTGPEPAASPTEPAATATPPPTTTAVEVQPAEVKAPEEETADAGAEVKKPIPGPTAKPIAKPNTKPAPQPTPKPIHAAPTPPKPTAPPKPKTAPEKPSANPFDRRH